MKSIPGSSSQAGSAQESQAKIIERALVSVVQPDQSPLVVQNPKPAPQATKKKKGKKGKKVGQVKAADARLEGSVDWVDPIANESAEEREDNMSSLTARFSTRMRKQATSAQRETTPGSDVPGGKRPKRSGLNDEVQNSPTVVTLDSPEQASDALPTLEGTTQGVPKESYTSLENGILVRGPLSADNVVGEAPFAETIVGVLLWAR